jgi:endonuclease YncB( thermonuclease family)
VSTRRRSCKISAKHRANLVGQIEGKAVVVVWSKKDGYGRLLGNVLLGSININLSQI